MSLGKCICHTSAKDELVNLSEKVLDDTDLGGNLGTAHDGDERTLDVAEDIVHCLYPAVSIRSELLRELLL